MDRLHHHGLDCFRLLVHVLLFNDWLLKQHYRAPLSPLSKRQRLGSHRTFHVLLSRVDVGSLVWDIGILLGQVLHKLISNVCHKMRFSRNHRAMEKVGVTIVGRWILLISWICRHYD
jgi:hypothetical protein